MVSPHRSYCGSSPLSELRGDPKVVFHPPCEEMTLNPYSGPIGVHVVSPTSNPANNDGSSLLTGPREASEKIISTPTHTVPTTIPVEASRTVTLSEEIEVQTTYPPFFFWVL